MSITGRHPLAGRPVGTTTTTPATAFGALLRRMRTSRRVSQLGLARLAGVNHTHISRFEAGNRSPSFEAVVRIVDALGLDGHDRNRLLAAAYQDAQDRLDAREEGA